jgi:membrane fusion protein (multidrug efflux system)
VVLARAKLDSGQAGPGAHRAARPGRWRGRPPPGAGRPARAGGASLLSVVPLQQMHVDANFKEGQLTKVRIGQPVT